MQRDKMVQKLNAQLSPQSPEPDTGAEAFVLTNDSCTEDSFVTAPHQAVVASAEPEGEPAVASSSASGAELTFPSDGQQRGEPGGAGEVAPPAAATEDVVTRVTAEQLASGPQAEDLMEAGEEVGEEEEEDDEEQDDEDEVAEAPHLARAALKASEAIEQIRTALGVIGEPNADLEEACEIIQVVNMDGSPAHGAVQALYAISRVLQGSDKPVGEAVSILKIVERMVRDVVVLRCKFLCKDPKDREEFLKIAAEAYGGQLDSASHKEIRAQLLLAYHKDPNNKDGFISNNQIAAVRRGGPRPRRRRNSSKERQNGGASAASSSQVPAPLPAPDPADAAAGIGQATPPVQPHPHGNAKRSVSRRSPTRGGHRNASTHSTWARSSQSRSAKKPGLLPSSSGASGSNYRAPLASSSYGQSMSNATYLANSAACLPYHQNAACMTYGNASSCLPYNAYTNWGNPGLYDRNMYGNECVNGYPSSMVEMAWDYRTAAALQANRPWQVLILLEFNHMIVRCDFEALEDSSWGQAIEFETGGYRMYIRPGADAFVVSLLEETRRTCALAIFTGLSPKVAVPMVRELFRIITKDLTWEAEQEEWFPPSVTNKSGIRVYIIERSERDDPDIENWSPLDIRMPAEQSLQLLYHDFGKAWEALNSKGYNFHKQNTMLIGSPKDRSLCPENVLGMSTWVWWESTEHMKTMRDRILNLFYEKPDNVITWLKPGIHMHNI